MTRVGLLILVLMFAAAASAVVQVDEELQRLRNDAVRALAVHVDDESDAA